MEFLKEILGEELFNQFVAKINAYNGNDANKDKQIKVGNIASGEYVGKGKYDALQELLKGKETELATANGLIADLKKGTKDDEKLQGKITTYEGQIADLQKEVAEIKTKSAIKVALLADGCTDVDYITFKLNEKLKADGKTLELDENDSLKDWGDLSKALKTQYPNQYASSSGKKIDENRLPKPEGDEGSAAPQSLAEALQQKYENSDE